MLQDWGYGVETQIHMTCDSSAARGIAARQGLGRMRHVDVRYLWLQQAVQEGRLKVLSVPTQENWSDTFTKALTQHDAERCYHAMRFRSGTLGSARHRRLDGG